MIKKLFDRLTQSSKDRQTEEAFGARSKFPSIFGEYAPKGLDEEQIMRSVHSHQRYGLTSLDERELALETLTNLQVQQRYSRQTLAPRDYDNAAKVAQEKVFGRLQKAQEERARNSNGPIIWSDGAYGPGSGRR